MFEFTRIVPVIRISHDDVGRTSHLSDALTLVVKLDGSIIAKNFECDSQPCQQRYHYHAINQSSPPATTTILLFLIFRHFGALRMSLSVISFILGLGVTGLSIFASVRRFRSWRKKKKAKANAKAKKAEAAKEDDVDTPLSPSDEPVRLDSHSSYSYSRSHSQSHSRTSHNSHSHASRSHASRSHNSHSHSQHSYDSEDLLEVDSQ